MNINQINYNEFKLKVIDARLDKIELDRGQRIYEAQVFIEYIYDKSLRYGNFTKNKYSYLWIKRGDEKITFSFDMTSSSARQTMAITAIQKSDEGYDVFFGVCLTDNPVPENKRSHSKDITLQIGIWTDIDIQGGTHIGDKYPPSFAVAKSYLPFTPSIIVNSGYGLHAYYLFSRALVIGDFNRNEAINRNMNFLSIIRNNAGVHSEAVDAVQDLSRVLRVPGTYNYKQGIEFPSLCTISELNNIKYNIDELDETIVSLKKPIPHDWNKNNFSINSAKGHTSYAGKYRKVIQKYDIPSINSKTEEVTKDNLISIIKRAPFETFFPERDKAGGWVCPLCGSGSGANGTGITHTSYGNHYKCWKCGKYGDIIDWIIAVLNVNFDEALRYGAKILNLRVKGNFGKSINFNNFNFKFGKGVVE